MNPLIVILSCRIHAENGINQAQRDTWLSSSIPYKFIIGDGTVTEDSKEFVDAWSTRSCRYENSNKPVMYLPKYQPQADELVVKAPDDYMHVVYKSKLADRWALENGYGCVFHCCTDTYVHVERLLNSGYEKHDLFGGENGGEGHWTSKRALEILAESNVDTWSDDGWRIGALGKRGISLNVDPRFSGWPKFPVKDNDTITSHLNTSPDVYDVNRLYSIHRGLQ